MKDLKHLYYFENLLQEANNELVQKAKADGKLGISQIQQPENPEAAIGQMRQEFRMMSVDGLMTLANALDVDP